MSTTSFPTVVGGLRSRLIFDNLFLLISNGLTELGWINGTVTRRHQPINFVVESQDLTTEVATNTLALSDENVTTTPWEVGSQLTQDTRYYYIDFFAESDPVGKHLIGDVRDILQGKYASLGRTAPVLDVYDLRTNGQPTDKLFSTDIVEILVDRAHGYREPWLRHWYSVQFSLLDYYNNDADAPGGPPAAIAVVEGEVDMAAGAAMLVSAMVETAGGMVVSAASVMSAHAGMTVAASVGQLANVTLAGGATLAVAGATVPQGVVALSAQTGLITAGALGQGTVSLSADTSLTARASIQGTVALVATASLSSVSAAVTQLAAVALSGSATLAAAPILGRPGVVQMTATAGLISVGGGGQGVVMLSSVATLTTTASAVGIVALTATAALTIPAILLRPGAVAMTATAALTTLPIVTRPGVMVMTATSVLTTTATTTTVTITQGVVALVAGTALTAGAPALSVQGNKIVNSLGIEQPLHGFNITGPEYAPNDSTQNGLWTTAFSGVGTFSPAGLDGASDLADPTARAALISYLQANFPYANSVRIGLNESAWNGLNVAVGGNPSTAGTPTKPYFFADGRYNGPAYQQFIAATVRAFRAAGYYVILSLFATRADNTPFGARNLPARGIGSNLQAMPNTTHSIPMWQSVATTFATDAGVIFDLYNEPTGNLSEFGFGGAGCFDAWLNGAIGDRGGDIIISDGGHISDITTTTGVAYTAGTPMPNSLTLGAALPYDVPGGATFLVGASPNQELITVASAGASGGTTALPLINTGIWAFSHASGVIVAPGADASANGQSNNNNQGVRTLMYLNGGYTAGTAIPASISVGAVNTADNPIPAGATVLVGTSVTNYPAFATTETLVLTAPYNPPTDATISVVTGGNWVNNHAFGDAVKYSPTPLTSWNLAGQNAMITAVRGAGAHNVVMCGVPMSANLYGGRDPVGQVYFDYLPTGWSGYTPTDPLGNMVCSVHLYDSEINNAQVSWVNLGTVASTSAPVIVGETRETAAAAVTTYATNATSVILSNSSGFSATGGTATYNNTTFSYSAAVPFANNDPTYPGGVTLTVTGLPQTLFPWYDVWAIPAGGPTFPGNYLEAGWDGLGRDALRYWKRVLGIDNVFLWALTNAGPGGQILTSTVSSGGAPTNAGVLAQRWMAANRTNSAPSSVAVASAVTVVGGVSYTAGTTCVDGPRSTFTLTGSPPAWLTINSHTGVITGTVPSAGTSTFSYTVTATNAYGSSASSPVTVTVTEAVNMSATAHLQASQPVTQVGVVGMSATARLTASFPTTQVGAVAMSATSTMTAIPPVSTGIWTNITPPNISVNTSLGGGNNYGVVSLVVDPANGHVYAGACYQGLFKSTDHGNTWTLVSTGANSADVNSARPWALTLDPAVRDGSGHPMLVTTNGYGTGNIYYSLNGGVDWSIQTVPSTGGLSGDLYGIVLDPNRSGHYLIGMHTNNAIIEAQYTAGTWTFPTVLTTANPQTPWLLGSTGAWFGNVSSTWFASSDNATGVYCTTDSGATWTLVLPNSGMTHGGEYALVSINGRLWFAGSTVMYATNSTGANAGTTATGASGWSQITSPPIYYETVVTDGTTIWTAQSYPLLGGFGGTWMSYPVSAGVSGSWTTSSIGTVCGPLQGGYDPINNIMYGGCMSGGVWAYYGVSTPPSVGMSATSGLTAVTPTSVGMSATARLSAAPPVPASASLSATSSLTGKSLAARGVWSDISPPGWSTAAMAVVVDPANGNVYIGTASQGIYKSTDHGATWAVVSTGTNGAAMNGTLTWTLAIDPAVRDGAGNPMLVTTAGDGAGQIFYSLNGGVDWTIQTLPNTGSQPQDAYGIMLDPNRSGHYLIGFHTDNAIVEAQYTASTNSWAFPTVLTSASPQTPWLAGATGAWFGNVSTTWFASSYNAIGVYCSTDSGATWTLVLPSSGMTHGGQAALVHMPNGQLWFAGPTVVYATVSTGVTAGTTTADWAAIPGSPNIWYETVICDGVNVWTAQSFPGVPEPPGVGGTWMYYPLSAGFTGSWTGVGPHVVCGPFYGAYDATNHIMYGACETIQAYYEQPKNTWVNITPSNISLDPNLPAGGGNNYGTGAIVVDPANGNVYLSTNYQGIFKSIDHGATWTKVNTGTRGTDIDAARAWALTLDPTIRDGSGNPMLVTTCGYGTVNLGDIYYSLDGGVNWSFQVPPVDSFIATIILDPNQSGHYLIGLHNTNALIEAVYTPGTGTWSFPTVLTDASPQTPWLQQAVGGWFGNTSSTWYVASSTATGVYATSNSGATWTEVITATGAAHGFGEAMVNVGGRHWFLSGTTNEVFATTSTNATAGTTASGPTGWTQVASLNQFSYMATGVSDGTRLWTGPSFPLLGGFGYNVSMESYPVSSGLTGSWTLDSTAVGMTDGPGSGTYDATNHIMYTSNGNSGIWAYYE